MSIPEYKPRRTYADDPTPVEEAAYLESDRDYFENNRELILHLLAPFEGERDVP